MNSKILNILIIKGGGKEIKNKEDIAFQKVINTIEKIKKKKDKECKNGKGKGARLKVELIKKDSLIRLHLSTQVSEGVSHVNI